MSHNKPRHASCRRRFRRGRQGLTPHGGSRWQEGRAGWDPSINSWPTEVIGRRSSADSRLPSTPFVLDDDALAFFTSLPARCKITLQAAYEALGEIYSPAKNAFRRFQDHQRGARESPLAYRGVLLVLARIAFIRLVDEALENLVVEHLVAYASRTGVVRLDKRTSLWAVPLAATFTTPRQAAPTIRPMWLRGACGKGMPHGAGGSQLHLEPAGDGHRQEPGEWCRPNHSGRLTHHPMLTIAQHTVAAHPHTDTHTAMHTHNYTDMYAPYHPHKQTAHARSSTPREPGTIRDDSRTARERVGLVGRAGNPHFRHRDLTDGLLGAGAVGVRPLAPPSWFGRASRVGGLVGQVAMGPGVASGPGVGPRVALGPGVGAKGRVAAGGHVAEGGDIARGNGPKAEAAHALAGAPQSRLMHCLTLTVRRSKT
ncbi:unnamed protein product [Lampetra planeri]